MAKHGVLDRNFEAVNVRFIVVLLLLGERQLLDVIFATTGVFVVDGVIGAVSSRWRGV